MSEHWITALGLAAVVFLVAAFALTIYASPAYPAFKYAQPTSVYPVWDIGEVSRREASTLWSYRSMDVLAQVFVLFAAATGCAVLLRKAAMEGML